MAGPTNSIPTSGSICVGVVVRVPSRAMSPASKVGSEGLAAEQVLPSRDSFEVARTKAVTHSTQVIDLQPLGNGSDDQLVRHTMGVDPLSFTVVQVAVAAAALALAQRARPEPTRAQVRAMLGGRPVPVGSTPQAISEGGQGAACRRARTVPPLVVGSTPAPSKERAAAIRDGAQAHASLFVRLGTG